MGRTLVLVTAPAVEPITPTDAIRQLRIAEASSETRPAQPTANLISPAAAGNVDNGAHRYRVTFVTANGETDGGDVSEAVTVADKSVNGKVTVSGIPIGSAAVTSRKLYRTAAGGTDYLLLTTIADNTTTLYTDNIADASLGAGAPSTNTTDDPYITSLIKSARDRIESETRRALCTQTWDMKIDRFPCDQEAIALPKPPVQSVTSITYLDENGVSQTLSSALYVVNAGRSFTEITLAEGEEWPETLDQANAITIRFVAGYGVAAAVPEGIKSLIKLALMDLYVSPNTQSAQLTVPRETYDRLVSDFRVPRVP